MGGRGAPLCAAQPVVRAAGPEREAGGGGPAGGPGLSLGRRGCSRGARRPLGAGPGAERERRWASCSRGPQSRPPGMARFAPCANFVERVTLGLGHLEVRSHRCWVPGWRRPAAQAHCPLPPQPPAGGRGRPGPRAAAAAGGVPPKEADRRARAGPMRQPPCARGRRGGRRAGPLGRRRRLVPPLPYEARRAQATGVEAGQRARDSPPGK